MKRFLLILIISLGYKMSFGQVVPPQGITYQAVIIDRTIKELPGQDITERYYSNIEMVVKFSILESQTGPTEYEETHVTKTDAYGLLNLIIGQGTPIGKTFNTIDWGKTAKWLKVEIDFNKKGTFELFSLEKMWSVPYAVYSQRSSVADSIKGGLGTFKEKDGDTLNEIQTLKVKGDSIFISKGNSIKMPHPFNKDNDSTNEIQLISRIKDSLFISKGNGINLSDLRDKDIDTTNEIQDLYLKNDSIGLTKSGNKISVSSLVTNNNGMNNSLLQFVVPRPCHQANSCYSLDSLINGGPNFDLNLIVSKGGYHIITTNGTNGGNGIYLLKDSSLIKTFFIKHDSILLGYLFENHFYLFVNNRTLASHAYPGKTINDKYYIIKLDTLGNYKWHAAINYNTNPLFAGKYFIVKEVGNQPNYNTVDLKTGTKLTLNLVYSNNKITPTGFCKPNNQFVGYDGSSGTCAYANLPSSFISVYFNPDKNINKMFYSENVTSPDNDLEILNRNIDNSGSPIQFYDYLYNGGASYLKKEVNIKYSPNGEILILTNANGVSSKKFYFVAAGIESSLPSKIILTEDSNQFLIPRYIFHSVFEFPVSITKDILKNNVLLRSYDNQTCVNGTIRNAKWLLVSFK